MLDFRTRGMTYHLRRILVMILAITMLVTYALPTQSVFAEGEQPVDIPAAVEETGDGNTGGGTETPPPPPPPTTPTPPAAPAAPTGDVTGDNGGDNSGGTTPPTGDGNGDGTPNLVGDGNPGGLAGDENAGGLGLVIDDASNAIAGVDKNSLNLNGIQGLSGTPGEPTEPKPEPVEHTVNFYTISGSISDIVKVEAGTAISADRLAQIVENLEALLGEYEAFGGWYQDYDCTLYFGLDEAIGDAAEDTTPQIFNAYPRIMDFSVKPDDPIVTFDDPVLYTLTYKVDGEVYGTPISYEANAPLPGAPVPEKPDYTFSGWDVETPPTMPENDLEISGTFAPNGYEVTFVVEGQSNTVVVVASGAAVTQPSTPPVPSDKASFLGWYVGDSLYDFSAEVTENITITAKFSTDLAVLFKDANGLVVASQVVVKGQKANESLAPSIPAPSGKRQDGWLIEGTSNKFDFNAVINESYTLTPNFVTTYQVLFISEGSAVTPQLVNEGAKATMPTPPTRAGYTFGNWTLPGGAEYDFNTPVTQDFVLTATWTATSVNYSVVYWFEKPNIAGDAGTNTDNYMYNKTETRQALAGTEVNGTNLTGLSNITYGYFSHGDTKTIAGNGTTVVNVYYKRTVYTLNFSLGSNGSPKIVFRNDASMTNFPGQTFNNSNAYSFTAKFGQDIEKAWPSSWNATISRDVSGSDSDKFTNWNSTWVTKRFTLNQELITSGGGAGTNAQTMTLSFSASWGNPGTKYVEYWLERLPHETGGTEKNGTYYIKSTFHSQTVASGSLSGKDIQGMTYQSAMDEGNGNSSSNPYKFYYKRDRFTLSFDSQGGSSVASATGIMFEQKLNDKVPTAPIRDEYAFGGWYLEAECKTEFNFATATMPDDNLKLFAKWIPTAFKADFYNYVGDSTPVATQPLAKDGYVTDPGVYAPGEFVEGQGYFSGWNWFFPGTTELRAYSWEIPVTADVKLYAKWKTDGFNITYDKGRGTGTAPVDGNDYDLNVHATVLGIEGYISEPTGEIFIGWLSNINNQIYFPGNLIKISGGDIVLTAQFIPQSSATTITFHPNFTPDAPASTSRYVAKNSNVSLAGSASYFSRVGYTLTGWKDNPEGTGTLYPVTGSYQMGDGPANLYAQWAEDPSQTQDTSYTVNYYKDNVLVAADSYTKTDTAWINDSPAMIAIDGTIDAAANKYVGYMLDTVNSTSPIPADGAEVISGTVISLYYVKDGSQTQDTSYTVNYYKDNVLVAADSYTVDDTAWINDSPAMITIASAIDAAADKYVGYTLDTVNSTSPIPADGDEVTSGTVINLYYTANTDVDYTVHYYIDGTTTSVAPDKVVDDGVFGQTYTETAEVVAGYTVIAPDTQNITLNAYGKEITFFYTIKTVPYTIHHILLAVDGSYDSHHATENLVGNHGDNVTAVHHATIPAGYILVGDHSDHRANAILDAENADPDAHVLKLHYQLQAYPVTFLDGIGGTISTQNVAHGSNATTPGNPTRSGFNFAGWDLASTAWTNVTGPVTVTALWTPVTTPGPGPGPGPDTTPTTPVTPYVPPVVVTPATPDAPVIAPVIPDAPTPAAPPEDPTTIEPTPPPLVTYAAWHLLNLILTILTGLIMVALFVTFFLKRKDENEDDPDYDEEKVKKHLWARLITIATTVVAIILFVLTQDMSLPMAMTDEYTVWHVIIAAATVVLAILSKKTYEEQELDEDRA